MDRHGHISKGEEGASLNCVSDSGCRIPVGGVRLCTCWGGFCVCV